MRDGVCIEIPEIFYEPFLCGGPITQNVPAEWNLEPGDQVRWKYKEQSGTELVLACRPPEEGKVACDLQNAA